MSIVKIAPRSNFTQIPNSTLNDSRLTWEARGLLCWLLSKPDNWILHRGALVGQGGAGRDKLRAIFRELEDAGYIRAKRVHQPNGQLGWEHLVYDVAPCPEKPSTVEPSTVGPSPVNPSLLNNTDLGNTDSENTDQESGENSRKNSCAESESKPSDSAPAAWPDTDWLRQYLWKEQRAFEGDRLNRLLNYPFWERVSEAANGLDLPLVQQEFAKMWIWLDANPRKKPTVNGTRRFVSGWFIRQYEKERRYGGQGQGQRNGSANGNGHYLPGMR